MGSLLLIVMLIFIILFAISVPTVIADLKGQRQKGIPNGSLREKREQ